MDYSEALAWQQQRRWRLTTVVAVAVAEVAAAAEVVMDDKGSIQW
jgi:hypothetical protein